VEAGAEEMMKRFARSRLSKNISVAERVHSRRYARKQQYFFYPAGGKVESKNI